MGGSATAHGSLRPGSGQALSSPRADKYAAELAYHFGQAASMSGAPEKAVRYLVTAARAASAGNAYEEAIRYFEEALGLISEVEADPTA